MSGPYGASGPDRVDPAASKPDEGRALAARGLAAQIDLHAAARRAAPKGSAEWHHHHEQLNMAMSQLQRVDSTAHASVKAIVALQDRLHQGEAITMGMDADARRERRADPTRRDAIARDRATLREAKDLFARRTSAADPKPEPKSPRGPRKDAMTHEEWKRKNG